MGQQLRPKQIRMRLLILMSVIIMTVLLLAIPEIVHSYQQYQRAHHSLIDIQNLRVFAETSNKISRERAPANKAMSSSIAQRPQRIKELQEYRVGVDQQINLTVETLEQAGFPDLADQLNTHFRNKLNNARQQVDAYVALPIEQRTRVQMDHAILSMFSAWDSCRVILQQFIIDSKVKNSGVTDYASIVLILADLRDQAGRVASNIMAPLSFNEEIPETNKLRSLQTQEQIKYLWRVIDTIHPSTLKTNEYTALYQRVDSQFIDQGLAIVNRLVNESTNHQPYYLQANQLTDAMVGKFTSVIDLQKYLLELHRSKAQQEMYEAQFQFLITLLVSVFSLVVACFTMIYGRRKLFDPLIDAQHQIVALSSVYDENLKNEKSNKVKQETTLTEAIERLKVMLKQKDVIESQLQNLANTDSLTGVSNRLALDAYVKELNADPKLLQKLSLIVVDIDHFKEVNDRYGHIFGDMVIVEIAQCLKANIAQSSLIVRFGGDEFLILVPNTDYSWVFQIAESILADVSDLHMDIPKSIDIFKVSVSIGIATEAESWEVLFHQADEALFRAKAQGRNKAVGFQKV